MARNLTIDSLNCNGLADKQKRRRILNHFFKRKVDIVLLQETHTTTATAETYKNQWRSLSTKHSSYWNSLTSRSCGVAILISDTSKVKVLDTKQDLAGRVISLKIKCQNNILQIQSIYAPSTAEPRPTFFEDLHEYSFTDGQIIVGGDFNMVEDPQIDRLGGTPCAAHVRGLTELLQYKNTMNLVDIWRERNPTTRSYSWNTLDDRDIHSRLDRFIFQTHSKRCTYASICSLTHGQITRLSHWSLRSWLQFAVDKAGSSSTPPC